MNNEKITGVLIDVQKGTVSKTTIEKSIEGYCHALNCSDIDIIKRCIGGQIFDIICDKDALLKANQRPSALSENSQPILFGNLFIANLLGTDSACNLREGQTRHILYHVCTAIDDVGKWSYLMLFIPSSQLRKQIVPQTLRLKSNIKAV